MKLALHQGAPADGDVAGALARARRLLEGAAALGARMLVLPELFLPGYNRPDLHPLMAEGPEGAWLSFLATATRSAGCGLTFGWAERAGDRLYNAATALGPDGAVCAHYRKIQLFGAMERSVFTPGTEPPPVFTLEGRRFGLLVCYDIEFPEHARSLARRGAEILLVPTANPAGFEHVQQILVPARAHENAMIVAYANYCGAENGLVFGGGSVIAGPDARPLASAGTRETLLLVDLPGPEAFDTAHLSTQLRDLRPVGDV